MSSPDFPDWQRPVASVERFSVLASGTVNLGGTAVIPIDTSQMKSISIRHDVADSLITPSEVRIEWWAADGVTQIDADNFTCWGNSDYALSRPFLVHLPVKGPKGTVFLTNGSSTTQLAYVVCGSDRELPTGPSLRTGSLDGGRLILNTGLVAVGGNTTVNFRCGPVARAITFRMGSSQANLLFDVTAYTRSGVLVVPVQMFHQASTTNPGFFYELACPQMALLVSMINNDSVGHNPSIDIFDVS